MDIPFLFETVKSLSFYPHFLQRRSSSLKSAKDLLFSVFAGNLVNTKNIFEVQNGLFSELGRGYYTTIVPVI